MQFLLEGQLVEIPKFNLAENISDGTIQISPQKINLLEGIYASLGKLANLSNFKIYIEAPYYLRFLRRIARFVNNNQNPDTSIPLKHITSFVYLAHKDFVIKQKETADLILEAEEIIQQFVNSLEENVDFEQILFQKENTQIGFGKENSEGKSEIYLVIKQNQKLVYKSPIDKETQNFLLNINWLEM